MSFIFFFKFVHFSWTIIALCRKTVQYMYFGIPHEQTAFSVQFPCPALFSPYSLMVISIQCCGFVFSLRYNVFLLNLRFMYFCCFCVLFFFLHPQCSHIPYDKISRITYTCTLKESRYSYRRNKAQQFSLFEICIAVFSYMYYHELWNITLMREF